MLGHEREILCLCWICVGLLPLERNYFTCQHRWQKFTFCIQEKVEMQNSSEHDPVLHITTWLYNTTADPLPATATVVLRDFFGGGRIYNF